jgi:hypothetical protein
MEKTQLERCRELLIMFLSILAFLLLSVIAGFANNTSYISGEWLVGNLLIFGPSAIMAAMFYIREKQLLKKGKPQ